ncbi:efflux RND transporter periplasmic adaptor subunit [Pseudoduganella sp. FT93W]|uniref:Efflux RND transporter periplasmic adaptor subunit n=1 Tax=Duganella fentianensis TaxID=2692177 RepID=A0A845I606_9BURK|nr:efflux RND transporter periplasmic adaptor subunit [Duganella fentianensis]MYN47681.1 efflux RND transporter periplasmic adaptor subunit [Duganella fentianensis]
MNRILTRKNLIISLLGLGAFGFITWNLPSLRAQAIPANTEAASALIHEGELLRIPENSPLRRTLAVAVLADQSIATPLTLPAVVEADPARVSKVLTPMAGRIVSLMKQLGDEVKVGDVLFTLDSPDFALANADAAKAQAALQLAKRSLERQRALDKSELAAQRELEQAQNDFEQASSEAARANARLAQTGAKTAGALVGGHLAVRAAMPGRVIELFAAAGGYWNDANAPLMTVADISKVYISANAQEKDLAQLFVGQQASIKLDAYPTQQSGQVRFVGEILDADTRTVKVRIPFDNRDGHLKPGMFGEATLFARAHTGILIPMTAVIQSGFSSRAFVETKPWHFTPRTLQLGAQVGEQVEVLSGLKAGDRIVTKDGVLLND